MTMLLAVVALASYGAESTADQASVVADTLSLIEPIRTSGFAGDSIPADSIHADSLRIDSLAQKPVKRRKRDSQFNTDITYSARDSIVLVDGKTAILYGDGYVKYGDIELKAEYIKLQLDSNIVYASGVPDSTGEPQGNPVFKQGSDSYESKTMRYNFKTQKGIITGTVTQQGEGYVTSGRTKKVSDDEFCLQHGKYTTCDQHDHPHFYLALTKAKMKKGKYIVSGPAYMVVADVPLPLAVPFGYFPMTDSYASGLLMPSFGEESARGFYLKGFGYYFAINDYVDLAITADVYTKGSWALQMSSTYAWRYRFNGKFSANFMQNKYGEKFTPDYRVSNDFSIAWSHTQDQKMSPNTTFSASVNLSTSSYNRNNVDDYYNAQVLSQNTKMSTINLTHKFYGTPLSLSTSMYVNQRTADSTINLQLPSLTFTVSRIYPFKRKKAVGSEKWYEKISFQYTMSFTNSITTKEDQLFKSNFLKDWKNGFKHEIPISASFTLFKYLNLSVSMSNNLKWYFNRVDQHWEGDYSTGKAVADTTYGFYNVYNFSGSVSLSTTLYGFYRIKSRKGANAPVFRHKITPTVGFSAAPDFGWNGWGYWGSYDRPASDGTVATVYYDRYSSGVYGGSPSRGATGRVNFSLANNLEMKYYSKRDTTGKPTKLTIIDNFSVSSGYNFFADSLNWSDITMNVRFKIWNQFSMNVDFIFDPYTYQYNSVGSVTKVNVSQWEKSKHIARMSSASTSFGYTFNNSTFKKKKSQEEVEGKDTSGEQKSALEQQMDFEDPTLTLSEREARMERYKKDDEKYQKVNIPWSLTFNYSLRYAYDKFNPDKMEYDRKLTHNLSMNGSISLTSTWHLTASAYYDITNNRWNYLNCSIIKDLHCWQISASFVPIGMYKTYTVEIGVKASILRDMKYKKESDTSSKVNWY